MAAKLLIFLSVFQLAFIILFGIFVRYGDDAKSPTAKRSSSNSLGTYYPSKLLFVNRKKYIGLNNTAIDIVTSFRLT